MGAQGGAGRTPATAPGVLRRRRRGPGAPDDGVAPRPGPGRHGPHHAEPAADASGGCALRACGLARGSPGVGDPGLGAAGVGGSGTASAPRPPRARGPSCARGHARAPPPPPRPAPRTVSRPRRPRHRWSCGAPRGDAPRTHVAPRPGRGPLEGCLPAHGRRGPPGVSASSRSRTPPSQPPKRCPRSTPAGPCPRRCGGRALPWPFEEAPLSVCLQGGVKTRGAPPGGLRLGAWRPRLLSAAIAGAAPLSPRSPGSAGRRRWDPGRGGAEGPSSGRCGHLGELQGFAVNSRTHDGEKRGRRHL